MNFRTVSDLTKTIMKKIDIIPSDIDLIVGIPRSGLLVANYIALLLNKPITDVEGLIDDRIISSGRTKNTSLNKRSVANCRKVLVVDDSVASGESLIECKKKLQGINEHIQIIYCAIYVLASSKSMVDIYFEILDDPRLFEWNIFHQVKMLKRMCFDIDGVLCADPTFQQNDDAENYLSFIRNAETKIIPSGTIGSIVTSRLEKYREDTEIWMKKNGISYDNLVMLNATAEERQKNNLHARFKATYYKNSDCILFIESEERQAIEINNITGKPVYCTENCKYYSGDKIYTIRYETNSKIRGFLRRFKFLRVIYTKLKQKGI